MQMYKMRENTLQSIKQYILNFKIILIVIKYT